MQMTTNPAGPIPRLLMAAMFLGTAALAFVAGVITVNESRPKTWEECFIDHMADAPTEYAGTVLTRYCRAKYPDSIQRKTGK